jgi:hypothetical protein
MARLDSFPEPMRGHLATLPCPTFETTPYLEREDLATTQISLIRKHTETIKDKGARSDDQFSKIVAGVLLIPATKPKPPDSESG